jgi:uncharacterized glyoxalase superfamily protein PhnB
MEEIYPMPFFVSLRVKDVAHTTDWYSRALGFQSIFKLPGSDGRPVMSHLRLERYQDLLLIERAQEDELPPAKPRDFVINLTCASDLSALAERARAAGGAVEGPRPTPWNTLEVRVTDPNSFVLAFSTVLDASRTFADVTQSIAASLAKQEPGAA